MAGGLLVWGSFIYTVQADLWFRLIEWSSIFGWNHNRFLGWVDLGSISPTKALILVCLLSDDLESFGFLYSIFLQLGRFLWLCDWTSLLNRLFNFGIHSSFVHSLHHLAKPSDVLSFFCPFTYDCIIDLRFKGTLVGVSFIPVILRIHILPEHLFWLIK